MRLTEHVVGIGEATREVVVSHRAHTSARRAVECERHMRLAAVDQGADGVRQAVGRNARDELLNKLQRRV